MMNFRKYALACLSVLVFCSVNVAAEPIRIGTTQSLTGSYKEFGEEQLRGLLMWAHDINARGSLLGRDVEIMHWDDHSDAKRSAWLYRDMLENGKVDLIIGPYSSDITLAATEVAEQLNMPIITLAASAEKIWSRGYKNVFGIDTPAANYMDIAVSEAAANGAKTASLIYSNTAFSLEVAAGVRREASRHGLKLVLDEEYDIAQTDFSQLAVKLRSIDADVVFGATYFEDAMTLAKAIGPAGLNSDMVALTVGPALAEFGTNLGAQRAEGIVGVVQWLRSVRLPMAQDFAYRYRQKYGYNPGVHAAIGYSGGQVIEAAVRLAGTTDPAAVREQLASMEFTSLVGKYRVDGTGRQEGKKNYLLQWQDEKRRLVAPPNVAERKLTYPRR